VLGRWSVTANGTARSGLPINVTEDRSSTSVATGYTTNQRPNRVPGVSLTPIGGKEIQNWINPAAFALVTGSGYGNAHGILGAALSFGRPISASPNAFPLLKVHNSSFAASSSIYSIAHSMASRLPTCQLPPSVRSSAQ